VIRHEYHDAPAALIMEIMDAEAQMHKEEFQSNEPNRNEMLMAMLRSFGEVL